jgi:hypothetical protein
MKIGRITFGLLLAVLSTAMVGYASDPRKEFDAQLGQVIAKLNREVEVDVEARMLLAELIQRNYGTREAELKWASESSISWGEVAALAYIQATTGRSFAAMTTAEDARRDFWAYAENAGMSPTKMAHSLTSFLKLVEKERNSRIFERLRASRRVQAMPDLGSGFGLVQEALDFRRIEAPRPSKVHPAPGGLAKGGQ